MTHKSKINCLICPVIGAIALLIITAGSLNALVVSVDLGTAANYTILAQTSLTAKPTSQIIGDVAYDGPDSTPTGFFQIHNGATLPLTDYATSDRIDGKMYATNYSTTTQGQISQAITDRDAAYTQFVGLTGGTAQTGTDVVDGTVFNAGFYQWGAGFALTTQMVLSGNATDVWVFKMGALTMSGTSSILLTGGAIANNVFWYSASAATFADGSNMVGNVLVETTVTVADNVQTLYSNLYAKTGVTLGANSLVTGIAVPVPELASFSIFAGVCVLGFALRRRVRKN
jgi:hypothetical protein